MNPSNIFSTDFSQLMLVESGLHLTLLKGSNEQPVIPTVYLEKKDRDNFTTKDKTPPTNRTGTVLDTTSGDGSIKNGIASTSSKRKNPEFDAETGFWKQAKRTASDTETKSSRAVAPQTRRGYRKYKYSALATERNIRILYLEPPRTDNPFEIVRSSLRVISLDSMDDIGFTALSYSWDGARCKPIICDDQILFVSPNCQKALRQFRVSLRPAILWVDSICINQNSVGEKSHQVKLMFEIYQRSSVYIWLGEANEEDRAAMAILKRACANWWLLKTAGNNTALKNLLQQNFIDTQLLMSGNNVLDIILRKTWFQRMWVIQEAMANIGTLLWCGEHWLLFPCLVELLLASEPTEIVAMQRIPRWSVLLELYRVLFQTLHLENEDTKEETGFNKLNPMLASIVLTLARNKLCTDPKDKVFSLYGILGKCGVDLPDPDYSLSLEDIYSRAAAACVTSDSSLDVLLNQAVREKSIMNLPSWVPDWNTPSWEGSLGKRISLPKNDFKHQNFTALGPAPVLSKNGKELTLRGLFVPIAHVALKMDFYKFDRLVHDNFLEITTHVSNMVWDPAKLAHQKYSDGRYSRLAWKNESVVTVFNDWIKFTKQHIPGDGTKAISHLKYSGLGSCLCAEYIGENQSSRQDQLSETLEKFILKKELMLEIIKAEKQYIDQLCLDEFRIKGFNQYHLPFLLERLKKRERGVAQSMKSYSGSNHDGEHKRRLMVAFAPWTDDGKALLVFCFAISYMIIVYIRAIGKLASWEEDLSKGDDSYDLMESELTDLFLLAEGRQIFVTKDGKLGIVEGELKPGDLVGHVVGAWRPIVIRKVEDIMSDAYRLVGAGAYVHGNMNFENWPKDVSDLDTVKLI